MAQLTDARKNNFVWGDVLKIHDVGPYAIVEYKDNKASVRQPEKQRTQFHPFVDEVNCAEAFNTLDEALAAAIAYRSEGVNHRADIYFIRGLRNDPKRKR